MMPYLSLSLSSFSFCVSVCLAHSHPYVRNPNYTLNKHTLSLLGVKFQFLLPVLFTFLSLHVINVCLSFLLLCLN